MYNLIKIFVFVLFSAAIHAQDSPLMQTEDIAEAEFHTVINPTDPNNIVLATIRGTAYIEESFVDIYYSSDFGTTWSLSDFQGKYPGDIAAGDPVMSFDNAGNLYLTNLVFREDFTLKTIVSKSTNKGETWELAYEYTDDFTDKPWMAIDQNPSSPHFGNTYLITVTTEGVKLVALDSDFNLLSDEIVPDIQQLPSVVVAKNGDVYTSGMNWETSPVVFFVQRFSNGGKDLMSNVSIAETPDYTFNVPDVSNRFQFSPYLSIDNTDSDFADRLYFTFTSSEADGEPFFDVLQLYSDDEGLTWSPAKQVHSNLDFHVQQYYPSTYINTNGVVLVDWYDRKNYGAGSTLTDFFIGISNNGGEDYTEYKLNTESMDFTHVVTAGDEFGIGEYHQLVATEETAVSFWSDGRTNDGNLNIYYAKVDLDDPISGVFESGLIQSDIAISNIYPLPVNNKLQVDLTLAKKYTIDYEVIDIAGKTVVKGPSQSFGTGKHTLVIDNILPTGSYVLKIQTDTGYFKSMQFIKP